MRFHILEPQEEVICDMVFGPKDLNTALHGLFREKVNELTKPGEVSADDLGGGGGQSAAVAFAAAAATGNDPMDVAFKTWVATGEAPPRKAIVSFLLQRMRLYEDLDGNVEIRLMRSPTEAMAWLKGEAKRREEALKAARDSAKREVAAIKIQCFVRVFEAKSVARALQRAAELEAGKRDASATKIQNAFRSKLARKELIKRQEAKLVGVGCVVWCGVVWWGEGGDGEIKK